METLITLLIWLLICALIGRFGKNRKIGFWWSFVLCLFLSPIIGLIITLFSKKKDIEFTDIK